MILIRSVPHLSSLLTFLDNRLTNLLKEQPEDSRAEDGSEGSVIEPGPDSVMDLARSMSLASLGSNCSEALHGTDSDSASRDPSLESKNPICQDFLQGILDAANSEAQGLPGGMLERWVNNKTFSYWLSA